MPALLQSLSQTFLLNSSIAMYMLIGERMRPAISVECLGSAEHPLGQRMTLEVHPAKATYP